VSVADNAGNIATCPWSFTVYNEFTVEIQGCDLPGGSCYTLPQTLTAVATMNGSDVTSQCQFSWSSTPVLLSGNQSVGGTATGPTYTVTNDPENSFYFISVTATIAISGGSLLTAVSSPVVVAFDPAIDNIWTFLQDLLKSGCVQITYVIPTADPPDGTEISLEEWTDADVTIAYPNEPGEKTLWQNWPWYSNLWVAYLNGMNFGVGGLNWAGIVIGMDEGSASVGVLGLRWQTNPTPPFLTIYVASTTWPVTVHEANYLEQDPDEGRDDGD
jgi:hypothetical protein